MIVIDATNIGVGGGTTHLVEIINSIYDCKLYNDITIIAGNKTLSKIPDYEFLTKKSHTLLNKSLLHRFIFQSLLYKKYIPSNSILYSIAGDFFTTFNPMVGMSRNMLLYERKHWRKLSLAEQLRLYVNYKKQKSCFKKADGIIFVSNYSKQVINREFDFLKTIPQTVIHHGVSKRFYSEIKTQLPLSSYSFNRPFVFNYISTVYTYKNHPEVIRAFYKLRKLNYPVFINFIGAIIGKTTRKMFIEALKEYDPQNTFSRYCGDIPFDEVHKYYQNCDGILYASSCENMPNIVIEAMLSGKPLVCSNLGPIPEFVKDNAFYFNPEDSDSIADTVIDYLNNPDLRRKNATNAQKDAVTYNWDDTARRTIEFIKKINNELKDDSPRRPVVLILLRRYLPGYKAGGALRSIANLIDYLGDEIEFKVITSDRDLGDVTPYANIQIDEWNDVGKAKVYYASPKNLSFSSLVRLIKNTPHNVIYFNSFFDPIITFQPLLARRLKLISSKPVVVAPRGEFSIQALEIKHWKKKPFIFVAQKLQLYKNLTWQASNESEADTIGKVMGRFAKNVVVAQDLPPYGRFFDEEIPLKIRIPCEPLTICFLSRISPKKNLEFALDTLSKIQIPIKFDIYGPIDDKIYWKKCELIIKKINPPVEIHYKGYVQHNLVYDVFSRYDLFFLPTLDENFGHVILESMIVGTPVLIANTTPWRNLVVRGVGWDIELSDSSAFISVINRMYTMETAEYLQMRNRVRNYALTICKDKTVIDNHYNLFKSVIV